LANRAYHGRLVYRDIITENAFPVIVDRDCWDRVQTVRARRARLHPRRMGSESPYILSGRLWCMNCGRPMNGRVCRNGGCENRYYVCTGSIQFGDCDCRMVRQQLLEESVVRHLLPLLDEAELHYRIQAQIGAAAHRLQQEVNVLESSLAKLALELGRIRQDYRRAKLDADLFNGLQADIAEEQAMLTRTLAAKRSELAEAGAGSEQTLDLSGVWDRLSYAQRRQVIHLLTRRIDWDCRSRQVTVSTAM
jgi:hypothetical protein